MMPRAASAARWATPSAFCRSGSTRTPYPIDMELDELGGQARQEFQARHAARERGLALHRDVIRSSANSIRAAHRGEGDRARELIAEAERLLVEIDSVLGPFPEIYYAGFVHDCQKEFAEASLTFALLN